MDVQVSSNRYLMLDDLVGWGVVIVVLSFLAARATRDMNRRGAPGWLFGLLVAFLPPVGLVAWAIGSAVMPTSPRVRAATSSGRGPLRPFRWW